MRRMAELLSADPRPSEREAARQVSVELSGDDRHMEGLRRDYRRLRRAGDLPILEMRDRHSLMREQIREEYQRRSEILSTARRQLAELEPRAVDLGLDLAANMRELAESLGQQRFRTQSVLFGLSPEQIAAYLASQGFPDEESALAEHERLQANFKHLGEAIKVAEEIHQLRMTIGALSPPGGAKPGE